MGKIDFSIGQPVPVPEEKTILVNVKGRHASAVYRDLITSGSRGIYASFTFDAVWDDLTKIAVFEGSERKIDVELTGESCEVPPEVMEMPKSYLRIGVYGVDGTGSIVIPTVYASVRRIEQGTDPSGEHPAEKTKTLVEKLMEAAQAARNAADEAERLAKAVKDAADEGEFDGDPGDDGNGVWLIDKQYIRTAAGNVQAQLSHMVGRPGATPAVGDLCMVSDGRFGDIIGLTLLVAVVSVRGDLSGAPGADGTRIWWTNSRVISAAAYESDGGVATIQLHSVDGATPAVGDYVYAPEVGQSGAPTALYVITQTAPVLTVFDRICSIKGDGGSGTGDYNALDNKPQIAGVTLSGDKSLSDLGVAPKPMLVTLSYTGSGDTYTADKTYAEITDAIAAGREVLVDWGASILRPSALGATWIGYDDSKILEFILHSDSSWTGIITDLGSYRTAADQDTIDRQQNAAIEAKYTKPGTGVPKTDLAAAVQTSLGRADTALQQHQDISGKADKVTEVTVATDGAVSQTVEPGKAYHFTGELTALTITTATPGEGHYHLDFVSSATAPTVTLPVAWIMPDGWTVEANTRYELDILDGYGVAQSWEVTA